MGKARKIIRRLTDEVMQGGMGTYWSHVNPPADPNSPPNVAASPARQVSRGSYMADTLSMPGVAMPTPPKEKPRRGTHDVWREIDRQEREG